ncbi:Transmembrane protein [Halotydeus destructor]|nr:Transmembrane protein [Halotydeus destructor]
MADTLVASGAESGSSPYATGDGDVSGPWSALNGFMAALFMILASELGDKTFIITTIMAMKYSRRAVFLGATSAAILMITLSVLIGMMTTLVPRSVSHYFSIFLFTMFGLQMLKEGLAMSSSSGLELDKEAMDEMKSMGQSKDSQWKIRQQLAKYLSFIFIESFTMNFFAEWGDRSQLSTILLAARENVIGVLLGAIFGHTICNGVAVLGGNFIGSLISVRTVTICGGLSFLAFAAVPLISGHS